jgi:hypothetical protein
MSKPLKTASEAAVERFNLISPRIIVFVTGGYIVFLVYSVYQPPPAASVETCLYEQYAQCCMADHTARHR